MGTNIAPSLKGQGPEIKIVLRLRFYLTVTSLASELRNLAR